MLTSLVDLKRRFSALYDTQSLKLLSGVQLEADTIIFSYPNKPKRVGFGVRRRDDGDAWRNWRVFDVTARLAGRKASDRMNATHPFE